MQRNLLYSLGKEKRKRSILLYINKQKPEHEGGKELTCQSITYSENDTER